MLAKLIKGDINKRDRKESGFTIVEVMIVLAIAGLILAIVFIAVPALQRNARDTQRKADVSAIQGGINTYIGNNNGQIPDTAGELGEALDGLDLGFYNTTDYSAGTAVPAYAATGMTENELFFQAGGANVAQTAGANPEDYALYLEGAECETDLAKATVMPINSVAGGTATITKGGGARAWAIIYALEGDPNFQCVDNV